MVRMYDTLSHRAATIACSALPVAILLSLCCPLAVFADWNTHIYGTHIEAALLDSADVPESSGLVASRTSPDIFWTHNDSGNAPRVWALRLNAADMAAGVARSMGYANLQGFSNFDWEDIAVGPGPRVYVFDGGDNPPCSRTDKRIHRFVEPAIDPDGSPVVLTPSVESMRFEYPDGADPALPADTDDERYDCETLLVHPVSGDIYLVTKRTNSNGAAARVYKLSAADIVWDSPAVHVLEFVADLGSTVTYTPTGGDIGPFGSRLLVRNYATAWEFTLPAGRPFDDIFTVVPRSMSLSGEIQGEAICYAADGANIFASSEVQFFGPQTCPIYIVPWQLANVATTGITPNEAVIRWDTATASDSTVDYGTTTAYGMSAGDAAAVTAHEVMLASLAPGMQYYFRVTSDGLAYPSSAEAADVFFTTPPVQPADFDLDDDVDQEDYGRFQACLSGRGNPQNEPACALARLDADNDVDEDDLDLFRQCHSGPDISADPNCLAE